MDPLVKLVVGKSETSSHGDFKQAVKSLLVSLNRTHERIAQCLATDDEDFLVYFGPVVGRRFIEESTALIYGRIDPIRLVVALKGAMSSDFEAGRLNPSSLAWADYVQPSFAPVSDECWSQSTLKKTSGIVRGLLSGHTAHFIFESGFFRCLDSFQHELCERDDIPNWVADLQKFPDGKALLSDLRRRASQGYSHLSKGIHFEFMPSASPSLDPSEIKRLIQDFVYVAATVAAVANASSMIHAPLPLEDAAALYVEISDNYS